MKAFISLALPSTRGGHAPSPRRRSEFTGFTSPRGSPSARRLRAFAIFAHALGASCLNPAYQCQGDDACVRGGESGRCEANRYCSFPDAECDSGWRYGDYAPAGIANSCVTAVVNPDAGADMTQVPPDALDAPMDADLDDYVWTPLPTLGAPAPRMGHTAVWDEAGGMIVWGGIAGLGFSSNDGARYAVADDAWSELAASPLTPRAFHTAVWTGSSMVVWGGNDEDDYMDTGAMYPEPGGTDWLLLLTPLLGPRSLHTAVWSGSQMIVFGGQHGENALGDGGRYSVETNDWVSMVGAPKPMTRHRAVWTGSEMLVWGHPSGMRYWPSGKVWFPMSKIGAPPADTVGWPEAVWSGSEMIVFGGGACVSTNGGRYDPLTDTWEALPTLGAPSPRILHAAVWTGSEAVFWGGFCPSYDSVYFGDGFRYDPVADAWKEMSTTNAPSPRIWHSMIWTGSEIIVWGGAGGPGSAEVTNSGARWGPKKP